MPRPEWTTHEEKAWLERRIPDFIEAQEKNEPKRFFLGCHDEWFHKFELAPPTAEEIAKQGGNVDKAASIKKKQQKKRVSEWFYNHTRSATSHRVLNLAKRKTGFLHPYQAYMTIFKPRVMPLLKERYAAYLRSLEEGATPMSELAFNAKAAKDLLAREPPSVHEAVQRYRDVKCRRASKNLLDSILKESTPEGEDEEDVEKDDRDDEKAPAGGEELMADLLKNIDSLPATLQDTADKIHGLTGWVGCAIFAGPHPRTGTMTTIAAEVGNTLNEGLKFSELSPRDWETIQNSFGAYSEMCFPSHVEKALNAVMSKLRESAGEAGEIEDDTGEKPKRKVHREDKGKAKRARTKKASVVEDTVTSTSIAQSTGNTSGGTTSSTPAASSTPIVSEKPAQQGEQEVAQHAGANSERSTSASGETRQLTPSLSSPTSHSLSSPSHSPSSPSHSPLCPVNDEPSDSESTEIDYEGLRNETIARNKQLLSRMGLTTNFLLEKRSASHKGGNPKPKQKRAPRQQADHDGPSGRTRSKGVVNNPSPATSTREDRNITNSNQADATSFADQEAHSAAHTASATPAAPSTTPAASTTASAAPAVPTPAPAVPTSTPAVPTSAPAVPTPAPAVPMSAPAVPTSTPAESTSTPEPAASTPEPAASTPEPAASTPPPAASTPPLAASTPPPAASTPAPASSAPEPAASTPEPAASAATSATAGASAAKHAVSTEPHNVDRALSAVDRAHASLPPPPPTASTKDRDTAKPSPVTTPAAGSPSDQPEGLADDDMTGVPAWIQEARRYLEPVSADERWVSAVREWLCHENAMGYPKPEDSRLLAKNRPIQVRQWVQRHMPYESIPAISQVAQYGATWKRWWSTLQPSARSKTPDGKFSRKRLNQDAWAPLMQGGCNGLFLVLISLAWWIRAAGEGTADMQEALEMADDMVWVFSQLTAAPEQATATEEEPPKKRRKIAGSQRQRRPRKAKA